MPKSNTEDQTAHATKRVGKDLPPALLPHARDAARYRWLRAHWHAIEAYTNNNSHALILRVNEFGGTLDDNARLDEAIDAAMEGREVGPIAGHSTQSETKW